MRVNLGFLGLMMAVTTAGIGFTACGNTVTEITGGTGASNTGGSGNGGSSQTTTVTATSSSGMTTTATTASSSSSGGGDNCEMACSHIQNCIGIDVCGQFFNLDCSNPQYDCTATCINKLDCSELSIQSGQACLSQCAPQDAGPPPDAGDPCMNACAHVQQCFGFDACAALGMQLDCSSPQNECIANCVNGTSCGQLGVQTFQACQQMCQGAMGDGGTTTDAGGGSAQQCQQCAQQSCFMTLGQCFQNQSCQGWLQCIQGCNMNNPAPSCYTDCDAQHANAKNQYQAVYACTCNNCDTQCAASSNPCGPH